MRLYYIAILILTSVGFALRLYYLTASHPFFDEYTTVLAARQVLAYGWPLLPSGLFYEHGLLATYLITPFTALFINLPQSQWQAAHWGLMLSRWPSLLLGTVTIPLIFTIGRRIGDLPAVRQKVRPTFPARNAALLAAGLFALSPEGVVWGGRARMYALATLLVIITVYWVYRGALYPAPAKYRRLALGALAALLLTQFGAMMLVPPLVISALLIGWLSFRSEPAQVWFLRRTVILEGLALSTVVGLAIWVKRLGRPLGAAALNQFDSPGFWVELLNTVTYQTALYFTWDDTIKFLARQFGTPHHFWLAVLTIGGLLIGLASWRPGRDTAAGGGSLRLSYFRLFLWLIFGLIIVETVTLLEPFRRNPRYMVMYLPLFYLIAGWAIFNFGKLIGDVAKPFETWFFKQTGLRSRPGIALAAPLILLLVFTLVGLDDLRIALVTPEPAYEEAFAKIRAGWQSGDTLLTMNSSAAGLYMGGADGFTVQIDAEQFLLEIESEPVDRWLGVPWIGTAASFSQALDNSPRSWYVIDTIRQPVYFRGDWQAVVDSQLEPVWSHDNVIIYRTRPDQRALPARPHILTHINLNNAIELVGYSLDGPDAVQKPKAATLPNEAIHITLFWQPLVPLATDYTTFLHLRNGEGITVAQRDRQPLEGRYPTSHWQPGETVIDPVLLPLPDDLPAGTYELFTGLYQLDTLARLAVIDDVSGENVILLGKVTIP